MENDDGRRMVRAPRGGKGNTPPLRFGVPETSPSPYAAVRLPNFRRFIIGLFAFTMAIQIQGTVVGWQIYQLTHDKLALGLIGLAEALPFIGAALYAGHVADRHDRRRTVIVALALLLAAAVALLVLPLLLPAAPRLGVRAIYGVIVASGRDRHSRPSSCRARSTATPSPGAAGRGSSLRCLAPRSAVCCLR
jgi:MFS family permease